MTKAILFANTDWYLYNFRLSLARSLREAGWETTLISPPGPYAARIQESGFRWLPLPIERAGMSPLMELAVPCGRGARNGRSWSITSRSSPFCTVRSRADGERSRRW